MTTRIIDLKKDREEGIALGAKLIKEGELVAFPTETVYGLGANAYDAQAVKRVFEVKGRPGDNPVIVHVSEMSQVDEFAEVNDIAKKLMKAYWPGPLTLVLPKKPVIPDAVTAGLDTVAVRMPSNEDARALIAAAGVPIAAPSANLSGKPSPTTAAHVAEDMDGKIPLILNGGDTQWGLESTVVTLSPSVKVLRPGAVTPDDIKAVTGAVTVATSVLTPMGGGGTPASPGMKYKHYSPNADVYLADGKEDELPKTVIAFYDTCEERGKKPLILGTKQTYSFYGERNCDIIGDRNDPKTLCANLFKALRKADAGGFDPIIVEALPPQAFGLAYMNRALRAAGFKIVNSNTLVLLEEKF